MPRDDLRNTVLNPDVPATSLEAKQPDIEGSVEGCENDRYYTSEFMTREWRYLWPRVWLLAGVSSDLPDIGSYFLFEIGSESVIVSRTDEGVKAFFNVCSHRGTRLLSEPFGKRSRWVCPFHSWKFNNKGVLLSIKDRETFRDEVLWRARGLSELACEEYAGLIFVNMDKHAPPLKERIGLPSGYLESYRIGEMNVVRHIETEWQANWKIGVEAFYESYHLHAVHPETRFVMGDLNVQYDLYPHGASRMIVPLGQVSPRLHDQKSLNKGLESMLREAGVDPASYSGDASRVRETIQRAKRERFGSAYSGLCDSQLSDSWATGIFPNVQIGCHPEGVFVMRFLPHPTNPEHFFYNTMTMVRSDLMEKAAAPAWMGLPEGTDVSGQTRPACERFGVGEHGNLGLVLDQDSRLLPVVQAGARSRGFRGPLWGEQEQRLRHFHAELERYLSAENRQTL